MKNNDLAFYSTLRYKLTLCVAMSVFFYLFLIVFLPFGVSNYDPVHQYTVDFLLEISNFFLVTFLMLSFNELVLRNLFVRISTIRTIIIWSTWTLILLGLTNFVTYNVLGDWHDFSMGSALAFIVNCSTVLIFPLIGTFFFFRYRSLQQKMQYLDDRIVSDIPGNVLITFSGEGSKDQISVSSEAFLFARAQDNYVAIHYLENDRLTKQLIRSSLSKLDDSIPFHPITRCHRSYLVNLLQVQAIKGGKNDTVLYLGKTDDTIPVSKSYREDVMSKLRELKSTP